MQITKFVVASFAALAAASPVENVEKRSLSSIVGDVKTLVNGLLKDVDTVLGDAGLNLTDVLGGNIQLKRDGVSLEGVDAEALEHLEKKGDVVGDVEKLVSDLLKNVSSLADHAGLNLSGLLSSLGL